MRLAQKIQTGMLWINSENNRNLASPFGGIKMSGIGRENGLVAYEEYTQIQNIIVNLSDTVFDWYADDGTPNGGSSIPYRRRAVGLGPAGNRYPPHGRSIPFPLETHRPARRSHGWTPGKVTPKVAYNR